MLLTAPDCAIMSRKSKWIEVKSPEEPASKVARRALIARLKAVWEWLRVVRAGGDADQESVHQLRVCTRRAQAALSQFDDMMPRKRAKWFARELKRLRKTAGTARDLDVLITRVEKTCPDDLGRTELIDQLTQKRVLTQIPIRALYRRLKKRGFRERIADLASKTKWRGDGPEPTFLSAAQSGLRVVAASFFTAASSDLDSSLALHEFRLLTKQFRYELELFAGAFAEGYRKDLYPLVEELQEKLGAINDHAAARDQYLGLLDSAVDHTQQKLLGHLIAIETAALSQSMAAFRQWWSPARAANLKSRFWQEISDSQICCA